MAFEDIVNNIKKQSGRADTLRHYARGAEAARAIQDATGVYNDAQDAQAAAAVANRAYIPEPINNRAYIPEPINSLVQAATPLSMRFVPQSLSPASLMYDQLHSGDVWEDSAGRFYDNVQQLEPRMNREYIPFDPRMNKELEPRMNKESTPRGQMRKDRRAR